ncbi:tetratricopeptide repeat protein [Agarivorans sp. 1_MG-2023]|uniref:YfgM family protein n=1 Tax=Agarivorans sp. 1_MG-2023 TaxID=3062634 RepID=UPI0026E328E0|nr:tetratricopeptide repeat protein [Agarivorans sp. 1_MG-2023]MDO6765061.1 tetratricopeptide repeat protein [Agarivorans sp. 1_MG-2023]
MDIYSTEEQQVQAIKDWWKKNGTSVIGGSVLGLAAVFGWRYFGEYQVSQQEAASDAYEQAVTQLALNSEELTPLVNYVAANQGDKNYSVFASLLLAKELVAKEDFAQAQTQLQLALDGAPEELKGMVYTRLARVQAQQAAFDDALASLELVSEPALVATVEIIKGDIYLQQGENAMARQAYQAAVAAGAAEQDPSVNLKLNDLTEVEAANG